MESLSLSKLNLYIRRVIALNFQEPVWVSAELLSFKEKSGHIYLELTEKDEHHNIAAQNTAVIWKTNFTAIRSATQFDLHQILREGNEVRLLVSVEYHVRYGLKLIVQNIDPEYTFGKIAQARLLAIEKLKQEAIWQKNKESILPVAIKHIAIITSKESAGFKDFENHLKDNPYNYTFNTYLSDVSVQGINSVIEICKAFEELRRKKQKYDLIVLIRGGGSRHDLIEFDSFEIAKEISISEIPVLTGIGHFIDESIADLSAYKSLKTPTAVADFILSYNREFELQILELRDIIMSQSTHLISNETYELNAYNLEIFNQSRNAAFNRYKSITELAYLLSKMAHNFNYTEYKKISELNLIIESNDPEFIMNKGYSLTFKENKLISKWDFIDEGDKLKTHYKNGVLTSIVNDIWDQKN